MLVESWKSSQVKYLFLKIAFYYSYYKTKFNQRSLTVWKKVHKKLNETWQLLLKTYQEQKKRIVEKVKEMDNQTATPYV